MDNKPAKVALVTGAAAGIGLATAELLHNEGYHVAIADYNLAQAQTVAARLSPDQSTARAYRLDVCSVREIGDVFSQAEQDFGALTVLVNNAGVYPNHPSLEMTEAQWDKVVDTNLKGTFFCCQAFAKAAVKNGLGGAIVNMASTSAFSARAGAAHYASSKAGVVMLTKSLAQEFGQLNIRVNAVAPGLIETSAANVTASYRDQFISMVPSGRVGSPPDISGVVMFLISKAADYINGEYIVVDGGFLTGRSLQRSL